jgi:LysM repeat protein
MRSGIDKIYGKNRAFATDAICVFARSPPGLPPSGADAKVAAMKLMAAAAFVISTAVTLAQAPENSPSPQIEALTKKIDEINTKIDALSQQILKIEQQTSHPGVMIGEATPSGPPAASGTGSTAAPSNSNTHVVAKGETLTAIAKQHKVSVEDLQKFNHIEDGRKLQAGQTILIPTPSAAPSGSASASPSPSVAE